MLGISRGSRRGALKKHGGFAATYYVDPAGSDAANGTSTGTAWATVSKVNASGGIPANSAVLFKRGGTWREQLVAPRSNITIGAYGSGARPVFNGADIRSSWTTVAQSGTEDFTDTSGPTPFSYWLLAETTGTRADAKAIGSALTPAGTNAVARVAGPDTEPTRQWAASFDGTNSLDRANASVAASFPGKSGTEVSVTFGCWVYANSTGQNAGLMTLSPTYALTLQSGRLRIDARNDVSTLSWVQANTATLPASTWTHVVVRLEWVGSQSLIRLFVNGALQTDNDFQSSMAPGTDAFRIGGHATYGNFNGRISEPFVFAAALSDAQIAALYNGALDGTGVAGTSVYHSAQTDWPRNQVFRNGVKLSQVATKEALVSGTYSYDDKNSRLYVYDNPSGATMEVSTRAVGVVVSGQTDVSVSGIEASYAVRHGIDVCRGAARVVVDDCEMRHNGDHGYAALTRSGDASMPNLVVSNSFASYNGDGGIIAGSDVPSWRVSNCTAHHNGLNPLGGGVTGNIVYSAIGLVGRRAYGYVAPPGGAVPIAAGANIATAITANPNNTAFALAAGTYAPNNVVLKPGVKLYGAPEGGTVCDGGATIVRAFNGWQGGHDNVVFANIVFKNYVPPLNEVGILGTAGGTATTDWIIENCEFDRIGRDGDGTGTTMGCPLMLGTRMIVRDTYFHHAVRAGILGFQTDAALVHNCEMAWCNYSEVPTIPELAAAAGIKVTNSTNLTVRNCYAHHQEDTAGIWTDIDCVDSICEGNRCVDNETHGFHIELDYDIILRDNFIARNNWQLEGHSGGIYTANSQGGQYYRNDFRGNFNGLVMEEFARGSGDFGVWESRNNAMHDNLFVLAAGKNGYNTGAGGAAKSNIWTRNSYYLTGGATNWYNDTNASFATWQATAGQDPFSGGVGGTSLTAKPVHIAMRGVSPVAATNVVIEDCTTYRAGYSIADVAVVDGGGSRANGVWIDGAGSGAIARRNVSYDNLGAGVRADLCGALLEYNRSYRNGQGVVLHRSASSGIIRHNTLYANTLNIWLSGEFGGETVGFNSHAVRDNIAVSAASTNLTAIFGGNNAGNGTGNVYQKNALGTAAAGFVVWGYGSSLSTYAALDTAYGSAQNNVTADPLLTSPASGDFTLQAGSPCIGTATDGGNIGAL